MEHFSYSLTNSRTEVQRFLSAFTDDPADAGEDYEEEESDDEE